MLRALLLGGVLLAPLAAAEQPRNDSPVPTATTAVNPKVLKAIDAWLKAYLAGKIDFSSDRSIGDDSIAKKLDALPKGLLGRLTARRELEVLLDQAVEMNSVDACERALEVAAVGLDKRRYTRQMAPYAVRTIGEAALRKFTNNDCRDFLLKVARGDKKIGSGKGQKLASQAASLRALGSFGNKTFRPTLETELGSSEPQVRLAAAEGLLQLAAAESVEPLADALAREQDDLCIQTMAGALRDVLAKTEKDVSTPVKQIAVQAAVQALGRSSWRADMACVEFLEQFRSALAIPALIDVLQRFEDNPKDIRSGKLSGLLRHRAHEALVSLSGAFFPLDQPDKWRGWWDSVQASFQLAAAPKEPKQGDKPGTVSTFFGIPVQGTRVVFVVDVSGSMDFPMSRGGTTSGGVDTSGTTRLDFAKAELKRAVDGLPAESHFNMVTFNGPMRVGEPVTDRHAQAWQKKLIPANKANKKRFLAFVDEMKASGGTNTWGGLEKGLEIKSLVYGDRYESHVDELFLLSDGIPTVGDVTNAAEIIRLVGETNRFARVRINTVYIAGELNERDRQSEQAAGMSGDKFMKLLAEKNGGKAIKL